MNQPTQEEDDAILTIRTVFDGVYPTHFFFKKRGGRRHTVDGSSITSLCQSRQI